jgi:hypothetical protein
MLALLTLGCWLAAGSGGGNDETTSTSAAADTASACSKLVQYCPTGYIWSTYVTDEQRLHLPRCPHRFLRMQQRLPANP